MKRLIMVFLLMAVSACPALADPMIFTHEGSGSGTLDGSPFGASDFVITAFGDTVNRLSFGVGWYIGHSSASISIDGVGDFDLLTGTRTFVNNGVYLEQNPGIAPVPVPGAVLLGVLGLGVAGLKLCKFA